MDAQAFQDWLDRMGYADHGGQKIAAVALGVTTATIRNYVAGLTPIPRAVELACSALEKMAKRKFTDLEGAMSGTAFLIAAITEAMNETDPTFKDRFVKKLDLASARRRDVANQNELEVLSWARELVTGFTFSSGKGEPFLKEEKPKRIFL